jgi:hypothetical protein
MSDIFETPEVEAPKKEKKIMSDERKAQLRETLKKAREVGKAKRAATKKVHTLEEVKKDEVAEILEPEPKPKPVRKKMKTIEVEDETEEEMEARIEKKIMDRLAKEVEERRKAKELEDLRNEVKELRSAAQLRKDAAVEKKEEKEFIKERKEEIKKEIVQEVKSPLSRYNAFSTTRGNRFRSY